jgi:isochorismate synthase
LGPAFDLLAPYAPPDGFFFERAGLGVVGAGAAERISVPAGPDQLAEAARALKPVLRRARAAGAVPVAVGAFPFDGSREAALVVPARTVRRDAEGETREITIGDDVMTGDDAALISGSPHDAFGDVQLRLVPQPAGYTYAVASALDRIHTGDLRKVVLARTLEVQAGRELDPRRLAHRLRAVDPECFAFAVPVVGGGVLVGASPELLVSRRGLIVTANPLAGSAPRSGDPEEDRASAQALGSSAKDRQEHAFVVEHVFRVLKPLCDELRYDADPHLLATATVWHLSTRFSGRLKRPAPTALELTAALHPTPAVCGTPTTSAAAAIAELEPFERGCYAGPVGWVDADGDGDWALALRCAELVGDRATLYAGAGIVADSEPERELDETERKFHAFLDSLRWG